MNAPNPYAPPRAAVSDVADPTSGAELAGRGTRLLATIVDTIIVLVVVYAPLFLFAGAGEVAQDPSAIFAGTGVVVAGVLFLAWCAVTYVYVKANGQTIAKKMFGIKVVRSDGSRASVGRIFWLRNVLNSVLSIIPFYGLVDALLIFGEAQRCLHDKIADTIVVKA